MNTAMLSKCIRISALKMVCAGKASHIGSALSISDVIASLYGEILKFDPETPDWIERDRFILT